VSVQVLTIGHSTHPVEHWLGLLARFGVTAVADVRSAPYSRMQPSFNREPLTASLQAAGMAYVFLGLELGARSGDPAHYEKGQVQYRRLAASALFQEGLSRVITGAQKFRLALMCAEHDPITCHRTILVGRELVTRGVELSHILRDGQLESHVEAMRRCCRQLGLVSGGLFDDEAALIEEAYRLQERKIAYVKDDLRAPAS
jgi:uncharacterized protein (DUF488 family)